MRRIFTIMCALCTGLSMQAQDNIINTRQANAPEGKILDMDETILSKELSPKNLTLIWSGTDTLLRLDNITDAYIVNIKEDKPDTPSPTPYKTPRHEFPAKVKACDNVTKSPQREDGTYLYAYTRKNNLYICHDKSRIDTVTNHSRPTLVSGQTVSRNEFGISGGIFWSPDAAHLAFYTKDEKKVNQYGLTDIKSRTGSTKGIRYPMAGMDSENVTVSIYSVETGESVEIDHMSAIDSKWKNPSETYLTNVCWAPDGKHIFIQLLDRSQKHCKLCMFDVQGNFVKTILSEDNKKYVEPLDPLYFINGSNDKFIYRTANRDGYRNLYVCDTNGNINRLTKVNADVSYIANDGKYVYYTSAEVSPIENHLFRVKINGTDKPVAKMKFGSPERLTKEEGWHKISMSPNAKYYVDSYSSLTVPRVINVCSADGTIMRNLLTAEDPTTDYAYTEISLGTVKSADGLYDNYYRLIKPKDFDPSKKYPVIVYVYGGPHSQMVNNSFMGQLRRWEMYMAQRGYIVYVQDNRGTQNRGLAFEQAIHRQCGQAEMADQMEGVKMLMDLPYVDKERIGVHGWSYGGFMTISLITNYPDVFKVAVAGGPVIDWKWYEIMYGERYMDHPDVNPEGYEKTSLINKAKDLKGKLLICQGVIDPVVVWQHCLSFVQECINNNVQVDFFPYPCAEHNMFGKERVHLHDKISMYFEDYL